MNNHHSEEFKIKLSKKMMGNKYRIGKHPPNEFTSEQLKGNKFNLGRIPSDKARINMSKAAKDKPKPWLRGKKPYNWKGDITLEYRSIRGSIEYRLWRISVFQRDHYICRFCGQKGGELHADHIKPFLLFPELRFAIDNGRTLCKRCHLLIHNKNYTNN